MGDTVWQQCLSSLEDELSTQQYSTWIRPLQVQTSSEGVRLLAPNRYIRDQVQSDFMPRIQALVKSKAGLTVSLEIGTNAETVTPQTVRPAQDNKSKVSDHFYAMADLKAGCTFDNFVEGRSNEFARAAAVQISDSVGGDSKCLLL